MNKTVLMGRLVRDPEVRYTQTNKMVVNFTLAVKRRLQEGTDFFNIVAWNKTGEFVSKYFKKGVQVSVIGRLQNRDYETKDGHKRIVTEVVAEEVYFADSKKDNVNVGNNEEDNSFVPNKPVLFSFYDYNAVQNFNMLDYEDEDCDLPF